MIENITTYTESLLKDYILFTTKRIRMIYLILSLVIIVFAGIELFFKEYFLGAAFLLSGLIFLASSIMLTNNYIKKSKTLPRVTNQYIFFPEFVQIKTKLGNDEKGEMTLYYNKIYKVKEQRGAVYLYINKLQALLVDISKFNEEIDKEVIKKYIQIVKEKNK